MEGGRLEAIVETRKESAVRVDSSGGLQISQGKQDLGDAGTELAKPGDEVERERKNSKCFTHF